MISSPRSGSSPGISKSEVSRICAQLDTDVAAWRDRSLAGQATPYVFLDATYCKARVGGRVVSRAVVIATGVTADGHREVLGVDVGDSENEQFWTEFLRGLRDRGLHGVQLVISDARRGLTNAIGVVCAGASWQRCRVHSCAPLSRKSARGTPRWSMWRFARSSPNPPDPGVREHVEIVARTLDTQFPAVGEQLRDAREEISAYADFPEAHWRQDLEDESPGTTQQRGQAAHQRRRHLPDDNSLLRLAACVLIEAHDESQVSNRRYLSEASMAPTDPARTDRARATPPRPPNQTRRGNDTANINTA
jgi:putative transposase